jgi:4,5-dihydroxyphthalate decarboxylase
MSTLRLTLACGPYDRTEALRTGVVRPEGIDLLYVPIQSPPELFVRMITTQAFDASEMSCAHYLIHRDKGDFPFVAIPVFPSRMFRHGYIFVNAAADIGAPKDLEGKRVGVPEYSQTAAVWIRGFLQDEYGVRPESIRWYSGGVNAPGRPDTLVNTPDAAVSITRVADRTLNDMLVDGSLDALIGARKPEALGRDQRVRRLFPNYRELEHDYFRETGIFPIMHTVVIREPLYQEQRWVADSLFKAFAQAKDWCLGQMRFSSSLRYTLPWLHADLEEMGEIFGADPWPYGLEANRKTLETLVRYLAEQGFLREPPALEGLFAPVTVLSE